MILPIHMEKRVDYALRHCHPDFDWSKFIFTDEKKFNLDGPDGYNYYWHVKGSEPLVYSKDSSAKKYVMVWGGISKNGQTPLMQVHGRLNSKHIARCSSKDFFHIMNRMTSFYLTELHVMFPKRQWNFSRKRRSKER